MTEINPNNYQGANATVVGRAGGEMRPPAWDKDGSGNVREVSLAVSQGYKKDGEWVDLPTAWYTIVAANDESIEALAKIGKGDVVRVDNAKLETREFTRKDNTPGIQLTLKYGTVVVIEAKSESSGSDGFVPDDSGSGF